MSTMYLYSPHVVFPTIQILADFDSQGEPAKRRYLRFKDYEVLFTTRPVLRLNGYCNWNPPNSHKRPRIRSKPSQIPTPPPDPRSVFLDKAPPPWLTRVLNPWLRFPNGPCKERVSETRGESNRCAVQKSYPFEFISRCKIESYNFPRYPATTANQSISRQQTPVHSYIPANSRSPAHFQASSGDEVVEAIANVSMPTVGTSNLRAASPAGRVDKQEGHHRMQRH